MRGVHLGCGLTILPVTEATRPLPEAYQPFPVEAGLDDVSMDWDNIDINDLPGVLQVIDLFDYPWPLDSDAYDVAVISHLAEHIPHAITRHGQIVVHDALAQEGWYAFFDEVWRILKPGGKLYCAFPYAWSNSGVSDPTHTRYLTPATMYYLTNADGVQSPFKYRMGGQWEPIPDDAFIWRPHQRAITEIVRVFKHLREYALWLTLGTYDAGIDPAWFAMWETMTFSTPEAQGILNRMAEELMHTHLNMAADFLFILTANKTPRGAP